MHERERAVGTSEQLADVVARHVLDHAAAGLEALAPPAHRVNAEEMVARGPRLDPARTREVAGERTAERRFAVCAQQGCVIGRFKREHLPFRPDCTFDRSERRRRLGGEHKLGGLIVDNAVERGEREGRRALDRSSEVPLGTASDDLKGLLACDGPAHGIREAVRIPRGQAVGHQKRGRSGKAVSPRCTCIWPSSAQR